MSANRYRLPERSIPCDDSWDVIVAGGGPSGCTAAMAAAAEGAKTLLIESGGALGGSGTSALVPAWCPFSDKEKVIYRGLAQKVFEAAKMGMPHVRPNDLDWVPIDAERLKRVYDAMVAESGAEVLFHTMLASVEKSDHETVEAIIVSNKAGLSALKASVFVDCTGDADLAAWAGAEFHKGDEAGTLQPATHCFVLTNVDEYALHHSENLHPNNPRSPIHRILASRRFPGIPDSHLCNTLVGPGTVGFNAGHLWNVDNTNPWIVSKALRDGRKMAAEFRDALAEFVPAAFGNAFLVATGSVVGIRETRRIVGDYVLSLEDYLDRASFPDEICRNSYFIDLHFTKEEAGMADKPDVERRFSQYGPGESHGIPYRCLTPRGLKNVLVAGRSISCERIVSGSTRVMPVCLAMGEAAGTAAAMALAHPSPDVHTLDTRALRTRLRERGAYLPVQAEDEIDSREPVGV